MPTHWTCFASVWVSSCEVPSVGSLGPLDSNLCILFLSKEEMKMPHGVKHVCYVGFYFLLLPFLFPLLRSGGVGSSTVKTIPAPWPALLQNILVLPIPHCAEFQTSGFPQAMEPDYSWYFLQGLVFRPVCFQNNSPWFAINQNNQNILKVG